MLVKCPGLTVVGCLAISVAIALGAAFFEFTHDLVRPTLPLEDGDRRTFAVRDRNERPVGNSRQGPHNILLHVSAPQVSRSRYADRFIPRPARLV